MSDRAGERPKEKGRLARPLGCALLLALVLVGLWPLLRSGPAGGGPTILVSLDTTLWNRLGMSRFTYARAVAESGGRPWPVDFEAGGVPDVDPARLLSLLADADGLLLSGGGDVDPLLYGGERASGLDVEPRRDRFELALLAEAERRGMPILGICRGAQLLNVARGGTLRNLREDPALARHGDALRPHPVLLEPGSRLAAIFGAGRLARVTTYHGQAVATPGRELEVVAHAEDGVIEAIEVEGHVDGPEEGAWIVGVQWHPEVTPGGETRRRLFRAFVEAAERYREARDLNS